MIRRCSGDIRSCSATLRTHRPLNAPPTERSVPVRGAVATPAKRLNQDRATPHESRPSAWPRRTTRPSMRRSILSATRRPPRPVWPFESPPVTPLTGRNHFTLRETVGAAWRLPCRLNRNPRRTTFAVAVQGYCLFPQFVPVFRQDWTSFQRFLGHAPACRRTTSRVLARFAGIGRPKRRHVEPNSIGRCALCVVRGAPCTLRLFLGGGLAGAG